MVLAFHWLRSLRLECSGSKRFFWLRPPKTGHSLTLHLVGSTLSESFTAIHHSLTALGRPTTLSVLVQIVRVFQMRLQGMNNQAICERVHCSWYRWLCSWSAYSYNCAGLLSTTTWVMKGHPLCARWKLLVKILSYQYNTHPRYPNSLLGNHRPSVSNSSSYDCNLTFTSSATSWTGAQFDATAAKSINNEGWLNNSLSSQRW